ncbi:MAG: hypothetical protein ACLQFF_12555 [Steroidobacteraceae bacterium]
MEEYKRGAALSVWRTPEAIRTWTEAVIQVAQNRRDQQEAQLNARLDLLADAGALRSPDHMRSEGEGICAVKTNQGLRAYGWFTQVESRRAYVISHVILKRRDKLDPADLKKAKECRTAVEAELMRKKTEERQ